MATNVLRRSGTYEWQGCKLPSVTAILATLAKPALVPWAAKLVAEKAVDAVLTGGFDADKWHGSRDAAVKELARAHWDASQKAKERGTAIHGIAEMLCRGEKVADAAVPEDLRGYVAALHDFWRDFDVKPLLIEAQVVNTVARYAGTLDAVASVLLKPDDEERTVVVLDYKSRETREKCALYPETTLQLTAYAYATAVVALDGTEATPPAVKAGLCVSLWPGGYVAHVVKTDNAAFEAFCDLVRVYEWTKAQKKNGG